MTMQQQSTAQPGGQDGRVAGVRMTDALGRPYAAVDLRTRQSVTIGRAERCDVTVHHATVSRVHCRIDVGPQRCTIVDLDSLHGVRVAHLGRKGPRERMPWYTLQLGNVVYLGGVQLIPIDAAIQAPIVAWRLSGFIRHAKALYGDGSMLDRLAGFGASVIERLRPRR